VGLPDGRAVLDYFAGDDSGDIISLDWVLPDVSGMEMLARLRHRGVRLPVMFLTANAPARRESLALGRGAIDFVAKSRGVAILAQRVHRIVRLASRVPVAPEEEILRHGPLQMKPQICRAYWKGVDVNLTVNEFKVVRLLTARMEQYVSPREIYDCMHYAGFFGGTGEEGYRTNVRSAIRRIRRKFHALDPGFDAIATLPIRGYQWRSGILRRTSDWVERNASWHDPVAVGFSERL
jgi:two-component system response regulator ChvI